MSPVQKGFTLTEVLVSLVVLGVGLLGIAALYVEGLRAGSTSVYRVAAVSLATDMADRMRANVDGARALSYDGQGPGANNNCVNGPGDCTPQELANDDWFSWLADVRARLPVGAEAEITSALDAPIWRFDITLRWQESGQAAPVSYTLVTSISE